MTDARLRAAQRDRTPEGQARALHERLRAGEVTRERIELAAYCGDEAARVALGGVVGWVHEDQGPMTWASHDSRALGAWTSGLSRWGGHVPVRAAVAGLREVWRRCLSCGWADSGYVTLTVEACAEGEQALGCAEQWLRCPCTKCLPRHLPTEFPGLHNDGDTMPFYRLLCCLPSAQNGWNTLANGAGDAIAGAATLAGEAPVREAIQRALVGWALGGATWTGE